MNTEFSASLRSASQFVVTRALPLPGALVAAAALLGGLTTACGGSSVQAVDAGLGASDATGSSSSGSAAASSSSSSGGISGSSGSASGSSSGNTSGSSGGPLPGSSSSSSSGGAAIDGGGTPPDAGPFDAGWGASVDGGPGYTGPTMPGTVSVARMTPMGRLAPGFAGFSFEKTHVTDGFFTGTNAPLIQLFRLLGPGVIRIGANDVDNSTWVPAALPVAGGQASRTIGTADVDQLAAFLNATGWKVIYGVNLKAMATGPSVAEAQYVTSKIGANVLAFEIGNEITFYTTTQAWATFATAIHAALPNAPLAGPADFGSTAYTVGFAQAEASQLTMLTHHYYRGSATGGNATMANLLPIDQNVVNDSQALSGAVTANHIRDGFRWGEMNSYSSHGAAGVSDAFGSALWSIDFMLNTAQHGSAGVNFHGGGENMDNNPCPNGPASCTRPFRYSPIDEANGQVTAAAPLFYGMLFVSRAGSGGMLATTARAGNLNFTAYSIMQSDGSTNVALVNKDTMNGVSASVDVGAPITSASALYLGAPSLTSTTGVTFGGAAVTAAGAWSPNPPYALPRNGNVVTVIVPPASAVLVHAQ